MKKTSPRTENYTFTRYLESKINIDNRAMNQGVWADFTEKIKSRDFLRVIEIGTGIGAMLERILSANLFQKASYTGIDISRENIAYARSRLPAWARKNGFQIEETGRGLFRLERYPQDVTVDFREEDVHDYVEQASRQEAYDLLVAHAFMDLIDIPRLLPRLVALLDQKGLFYFTLNYDGVTILEPPISKELDRLVLNLYNATMDKRLTKGLPSGDSQSGRHLFSHIRKAGGHILAAGASDWVVFAGENGFTEDETYFLHFIIHTIFTALENHPQLNSQDFKEWIHARHAQVDSSELVYVAHQIDFLGQV